MSLERIARRLRLGGATVAESPKGPLERGDIAARYISGDGIEIGALHNPLPLPTGARARYVDRLSAADLRKHYPELAAAPLVDPEILDDGERLATVADASQDFVIANHILEHFENPIRAVQSMMRVLKPGGVLYLAVPDMRRTFDRRRPSTSLDHTIRDYREGPVWSRRSAYMEWATLVDGLSPEDAARQADHYMQIGYSIHFHAWPAHGLMEMLLWTARETSARFDIEFFAAREEENLFILRKAVASDL